MGPVDPLTVTPYPPEPETDTDEAMCDETCAKFVDGGPVCRCYSGEGEIWEPGC